MVSVKDREIFRELVAKISHLFIERSEEDWKLTNKTLEDLNSLNYRYPLVENPTKAVLLINLCCSHVPIDEELLVPKCCRLITNLINSQKVIVEGRTFKIATQWCLQVLSHFKNQENVTLNVLIALEALLRSNAQNNHSFIQDIISPREPIVTLIQEKCDLLEIFRYALQCIECCTIPREDNDYADSDKVKIHLDSCFETFSKVLTTIEHSEDVPKLKALIVCLRGLENIVIQSRNVKDKLGIILGIVKSYMLFGIKNINFLKPKTLLPSSLSIPDVPTNSRVVEKKGGKIIKQRKHYVIKKEESRKTEEWMNVSPNPELQLNSKIYQQCITSDSDFSDSEANKGANLFRLQSRIRHISLSLLLTTAKKTEKSTMFSYWSSFIPENKLSGKHYLTTCILEDPSVKGRTEALNVLLFLITTCKPYLSKAETSVKSTSFTSFSIIMGYMIVQLHHSLSLALSDKTIPVLAQVLKCYAALVQATPYNRLSQGLTSKVVRGVKQFAQHKDPTIQAGALMVLGCILASEPVLEETKKRFLVEEKPETNTKNEAENDDEFSYAEFSSVEDEDVTCCEETETKPWILETCLSNLVVDSVENTISTSMVKIECLHVISSMCRNYFDFFIYPFLLRIGNALNVCLLDKNIDLRLNAERTIDSIGQAMEIHLNNLDSCSDDSVTPGLIFWQNFLNDSLTSLIQFEKHPIIKSVGCDCLGSIGSHVFERLPRDKQILCITLLFACSRDDEPDVRGSAIRALGIYVSYPTLREDPGFVVDTAEAVYRSIHDKNFGVKIKASWAMGNLSDSLVLNSANDDLEELPNSLLYKLLEKCVKSCGDNDKIRMNIVRTFGNLLQLIKDDLIISQKFKLIVDEAVKCLVKTATTASNMKVRWNSCYAIGNILKNETFHTHNSEWMSLVFGALNDLVVSYRNFKVRIKAALALSSPKKRQFYGSYYFNTWSSLLKALENSEKVEEFSEFQHRDNLVEQICLTLGHLTSLLEIDDLPLLYVSLTSHTELLKIHMKRVNEILVPEKSDSILSAALHLKSFNNNSNFSTESREALNILKDVFIQDLYV